MSRNSNRKRLSYKPRSSRNTNSKQKKICVGDMLLVDYLDEELQGNCLFHGPVDAGKQGFINLYGIELGDGEGESNGTFGNMSKRIYFTPTHSKAAVFLKKKHILKVLTPINGKRFTLADRVLVKGRGNGSIKYIGPVLFGPHLWYGIALDKKLGRNDGMVQSIRYFACAQQHGVFVREEKLVPLDKNNNPISAEAKYQRRSHEEMSQDLFEACVRGDIKTVRSILSVDKNAARDARDTNTDATGLMTACYNGYYQVVHELLQTKKVDINETNYHGMTALHMAAQAGYGNVAEILIKYGIEVDTRTEDGTTALYMSVEKGNEEVVHQLLSALADANLSSRDNESPLIQACHRGYHRIVLQLLRAPNIKINQKRKTDGATALFVAAREGSNECIQHLISNVSLFVNESKTNGRSPLFISSFFGHQKIVQMLINHSHRMSKQGMNHGILNVNQADSKGFTPLFVAAQNGHKSIVTLLLQNKADVNLAEQRGHTPLWISALRGHVDVVRVLLSHPKIDIDYKDLSGVTALWAACQNNNAEVVELLLHPRNVVVEEEYDNHKHTRTMSLSKRDVLNINTFGINSESDEDISPLQSEHDQQYLHINNNRNKKQRKGKQKKTERRTGANPNLAKHDGCTPLWIAASRGNSDCMKPLINYGADLNKPDRSQGATPLFVSCQNGKKMSVDLLLGANADVNRPRSGDGTSPLMMAAHNGHANIVDVLLKSGADPMQGNTTGLNALGCAAMQGHAEIVKIIYQHLLNVKEPNEIIDFVNAGDGVNGWTPLHLACMGGYEHVIKYLIECVKVDIFKKDYENKTGLEHAWQNGHQQIVSWLSQLEHRYSSL